MEKSVLDNISTNMFYLIIYVNPVINLFVQVWLEKIKKNYKPHKRELFAQAKKFDGSYLPPCFSAMPGLLPE